MNGRARRRWMLPIVAAALIAASCGGGDDDDAGGGTTAPSPSTTPTATEPAPTEPTEPPDTQPTATTAPPETGAITSIDDIRPAVVQVLAQGSFRDPLEGQVAGDWSGSGFLIDPDGHVVTNNHVVTGAGVVKVLMDDGEEIPARVIGVSECSDLALLELTEPGPYPYLEWYGGDVAPPLDVYAVGFPLGDPEFTITRGIVSKADVDGRTLFSSVRHVIEHDASIQPGNSGGPLVTEDAQVVGVNYEGANPVGFAGQFFAIAADIAAPVVDELRDGDVETIGVNGQAVVSDDGSLVGVWVAAVEAGSSAANAGVLAGDLITTLNGVPMSPGTMETYCDVLRTAVPGDAIGIQVLRFDTGEVWEGELDGMPMAVRFSVADELAGEVPDEPDPGAPAGYTYEPVVDDTATMVVEVPIEWAQRDTAPRDLELGAGPVPSIWAAPDLPAFEATYDAPGMLMLGVTSGAAAVGTPDDALDLTAPGDPTCALDGREDYDDPVFTGRLEVWTCGSGSLWVTVAANPLDNPDAIVLIGVVAVTEADLEALDQILYTFNFG